MTGIVAPTDHDQAIPDEALTAPTTYVPNPHEDWQGIIYGQRWAVTDLDFSFPTSPGVYSNGYGAYGEPTSGFEALNTIQKNAVRAVFNEIESFTGLTFSEKTETTTNHAVLRFAMTDESSTAHGYYPSTAEEGGDSWYNNTGTTYDNPVLGNYAYDTFAHEIGHTLGLAHGHDTGNVYGALPYATDSNEYSIMTYRDHVGDEIDYSENETWGNPQSYMMYDIAALQYMYGADFSATGNVWSGNSVYTFSTTTGEMFINGVGQGTPGGNRILRTVWDGNGTDTYDLSNYTTDLSLDLRPGEWSTFSEDQLADLDGGSRSTNLARGNLANALLYDGDLRSLIENATGGSGNDKIVGNVADNVLSGNGGGDNIRGGDGDDTILGGAGNDILFGEAGADRINGGIGYDQASYVGSTAGVIVDLRTGTGMRGEAEGDTLISIESLRGSNYADHLIGDDADNRIRGGSGADTLRGMDGDDQLLGDGGNDIIAGNEGSDQLFGDNGADTLSGGTGSDTVDGGNGNDTFIGDFDKADDIYLGGDGVDTFDFSRLSDVLTIDLTAHIASSAQIGTDSLSGIERIYGGSGNDTITGDADTRLISGNGGADVLSGGAGDNNIFGGTGNDILRGNAGFDRLDGGRGNDTLSGGVNADIFVFIDGGGDDVITDFEEFNNSEKIDLSRVSSIIDFDDLQANHLAQDGADAVITFGGNTITLNNVNIADLDGNDFIF
ncbi:protease [Jiella endophytica]|uniref:Protease n=1 Tax=Jiella endophytica TaxID=2558362 RepID=A0A4Y8RBJ8_9HYPH|nr:M12 family metallo-peptidase [Jiella endophytica]TFF19108.1 protease [Jiella endophytica]